MRIIVDGHGGDNSPVEVLKGCAAAVKKAGIDIILCGNTDVLKKTIKDNSIDDNGFSFVNAADIIYQDDDPALAIRSKKDSSMVVGLKMLKEGKGDAFVSAGSTGALLIGATLIVRRISGIKRAALSPLLPSAKGNVLLIDCGANLEVKPEQLLQFGQMGSCYMEKVMGIKNPRVGLVNVGTEETKGTSVYQQGYSLLKESSLNFIGNIEGRDVAAGAADVAVCDGFIGNTVLKVTEGVAIFMVNSIKDIFLSSTKSKLAALLIKPQLKKFKAKLDYNEKGGAIILGIDKPVIKAHGSSKEKAFCAAILQAKKYVDSNVVDIIRNSVKDMHSEE